MFTKKFENDVLVRVEFGQFGNYGTQLVIKLQSGMPVLSLENWAYGETAGSITTYEGVTADKLEKLGKELIQAAGELRKEAVLAK